MQLQKAQQVKKELEKAKLKIIRLRTKLSESSKIEMTILTN